MKLYWLFYAEHLCFTVWRNSLYPLVERHWSDRRMHPPALFSFLKKKTNKMYFVIGCLCFVLATPSLVLAENFADKIYRCYQHQIPQQLMDKPWFDFLTMEKNVFLDFRVKNEEQLNQVHAWLNVTAGDCQVRVDNLTQLIKNEQRPSRISSMRLTADKIEEQFFAEYRSTKEIVQQLQKYAQKYPNLVRFNQSIGQSHEKRSLSAMHITAPSKDQVKKTKPLIVYVTIFLFTYLSATSHVICATGSMAVCMLVNGYPFHRLCI